MVKKTKKDDGIDDLAKKLHKQYDRCPKSPGAHGSQLGDNKPIDGLGDEINQTAEKIRDFKRKLGKN